MPAVWNMTAERVCWAYLECMYLTKNVHKRQNSTIIYKLFLFHEKICDILTMLKFPMFCASNLKCPIIKVSYPLWDSYAHYGGDFLLTSNNACAKLSLLQYLSFALAKHRLRVSQTVLLCPLDIVCLCLFYPAIIGCTSVLNS